MLVLAGAQERGADQRAGAEIERPPRLLAGEPADGRLPLPLRQGAQVDHRQVQLQLRYHLHRGAAAHGEGGAQRLVAARHLPQAAAQGGDVQRAAEADGGGHVVGRRARLELLQEPEPLLGEGERQIAAARHRHERRRFRPGRRRARAASTASASAATVGRSNSRRSGSSTPKLSRTREITWVASSEWPPRSKKLSWMPTVSRASSAAQIAASRSSAGLRGAAKSAAALRRSGAGRARRSTLPVGASGRAAITTKSAGTM